MKEIRRVTRRQFSAEEKIRIVLTGLRGEDSIAEDHLELGKINPSLLAWWGLEAHFERRCKPRPQLAKKVGTTV